MKKFKVFLVKHKRTIIRILILIGFMLVLGCVCIGVLLACGVMRFNGGFEFNTDLFNEIKGEWWFVVVWIVLQVVITSLLCFVPATSMMFILGAVALFGANWRTFLISFSGVILSSISMDLIGRFGGQKLVVKLIGADDYNSAYKLVNEKGLVYIPFMYLLPVFPDDAICMVCGVMRIKFWLHLIYILTCRGVGCATIVFGLSLVPFDKFTGIYDWLVFITVVAFWIIIILFLCKKLNVYIEKKRNDREDK